MAGWLAEFGPDVQVLDPPELRAAVIGRLRAAVAGNGLAASDEMTHPGARIGTHSKIGAQAGAERSGTGEMTGASR
jgi:hypothetical protein